MNNIQIRCTNSSCHFYSNSMPWPEGVPLTVCPICGSAMGPSVGMKGNKAEDVNAPGRWLAELAEDPDFWVPGAEVSRGELRAA